MKRRHFVLLLGGGSAGATSVGSGAFSSVSANRSVSVDVVPDDEAYLGIEQVVNGVVAGAGAQDAIRLHNAFASNVRLTATTDDDRVGEYDSAVDGPLSPGEVVFLPVSCRDVANGPIEFSVTVTGSADGATVEMDRAFSIPCIGVDYQGAGTVTFRGAFDDVEVTLEYGDGSTETRTISSENGTKTVSRNTEKKDGGTICAVTLFGVQVDNPVGVCANGQ